MTIRSLGAGLALLLLPVGLQAQTVSTESDATHVVDFGGHSTNGISFAQTFRTPNPDDIFLQSVRIGLATASASRGYTARLMEWALGTLRPVGDVLFSSSGTTSVKGSVPVPYLDFDLGGLQLDPAKIYAFFISVPAAGGRGGASTNITQNDVYAGGEVYYLNESDPGRVQGTAWNHYRNANGTRYDLGFTAEFGPAAPLDPTVAPEPVSMTLLGTGLFGVAAVRRRRRTRALEG